VSNSTIDIYIAEIVKELKEENLAIFCGAGMSMPAGHVDWKTLMRPIADELKLDIEKETDLIALAQYHCNANAANRSKLNQMLIDEFTKDARVTANHEILSRLPISTYWTTNYDRLIETALTQAGKRPDVKYTKTQLATTRPGREAIVYKMHGDIEHPDEAILTKDDYESYYEKRSQFLTALAGDLISKTFLFLGFSFSDPNLDYILSRVRVAYSQNGRRHYCFLRKVNKWPSEKTSDFEYRERKQEYFLNDLARFNIKPILLDKYEELTQILGRIEARYRRHSIFISGAAQDFGPWGQDATLTFVHDLTKEFVKSDLRIVSGFGLGIGSAVISGALEQVLASAGSKMDQLILRPFPQNVTGSRSQPELWRLYREDMCSYAGIALFILGNKIQDGSLVKSDGMDEEFAIAQAKHLVPLPIGALGFKAKEFWDRIDGSFDSFYGVKSKDFKKNFKTLGDSNKTPQEIIQAILAMVKELTN
jgi:hypothetical protein